ncbi:MAG: hypothetical protein PHX83_06805 [Acidobacteriia bacterium]|nr:hypothetical protein [Terriglobia bacterium]
MGQEERMPGTCAGHRYLESKIDSLASDVRNGFERIGQKIEDMRVEQAETNSSLKGAWHRINELERQVGDIPIKIEKAIHNHVRGCPINDVTEVGIKSSKRHRSDEPIAPYQSRRNSIGPSKIFSAPKWAIGLGIGVVLAIVLVGIFVGVFMSTGDSDKASKTVRGLAEQVGSHATIENETGDSPQAATAATGGSYDDPDRN